MKKIIPVLFMLAAVNSLYASVAFFSWSPANNAGECLLTIKKTETYYYHESGWGDFQGMYDYQYYNEDESIYQETNFAYAWGDYANWN